MTALPRCDRLFDDFREGADVGVEEVVGFVEAAFGVEALCGYGEAGNFEGLLEEFDGVLDAGDGLAAQSLELFGERTVDRVVVLLEEPLDASFDDGDDFFYRDGVLEEVPVDVKDKPPNTPIIVTDVVRDIDTIAKQVTYSGWNESQPGDKEARKQIRLVLQKYALPVTGALFDNAYAYIRENY